VRPYRNGQHPLLHFMNVERLPALRAEPKGPNPEFLVHGAWAEGAEKSLFDAYVTIESGSEIKT
jgi:hypothetical protein